MYNIAYGTGSPGGESLRLVSGYRYLKTPEVFFAKIVHFLRHVRPDIVALVETDLGSRRTGGKNQVEKLACHLQLDFLASAKYGTHSLLRRIPYMAYQANALLSNVPITEPSCRYLPIGVKKLVLSGEISGISVFVIHLSLQRKTRASQLQAIAEVLPKNKPTIVCGDFNTFAGTDELLEFYQKTGLRNANRGENPTYPSWSPRSCLDHVLCSEHIQVYHFEIPHVEYSDHLPIIIDFNVLV